jgi:hypothetical protein
MAFIQDPVIQTLAAWLGEHGKRRVCILLRNVSIGIAGFDYPPGWSRFTSQAVRNHMATRLPELNRRAM